MKPYDISKFMPMLKKNDNIQIGFTDPRIWIDTGNYALNYRISSDFHKGFPLEGKMTLFAGESGSGKSYIATANAIKYCQKNGIFVILIDTEKAIDGEWMRNLGVDPDSGILKIDAGLVDDLTEIILGFLKNYKETEGSKPVEERPPVLVIIDSLGMATTSTEVKQAEAGDNKGDMGRKQKQIYSLCRTFIASIGSNPIGVIATQHTYTSQDMFSPDAKIAGGSGLEFTPSIIIAMRKKKTREDDNGVAGTKFNGVHVDAMVRKTRYGKPFQEVGFKIPYDTGLNPYSGLFDLFANSLTYKGNPIIQKAGAYVSYNDLKTGEQVFKKYRKSITGADYDRIMDDYMSVCDDYVPVDENDG